MRSGRRLSSSLLCLVLAAPAAAQPSLFVDHARGGFEWHTLPRDFTGDGELSVFTRSTATTGRELWRSDGSEEGTFLLVDACSGPCDGRVVPLGSGGGLHLFLADGALWRTDGSRAGTVRLAAMREDQLWILGRVEAGFLLAWQRDFDWWMVRVGPADEKLELLRRLAAPPIWRSATAADARRAFFVERGSRVVWTSDGSASGTYVLPRFEAQVRAIHPLADGMGIWEGDRLWLSDGSASGTVGLLTFPNLPEPGFSEIGVLPGGGPDKVFFMVFPPSGVDSRRLWVTDGTPAGSRELLRSTDLEPAEGERGRMPVSGGRLAYRVGD